MSVLDSLYLSLSLFFRFSFTHSVLLFLSSRYRDYSTPVRLSSFHVHAMRRPIQQESTSGGGWPPGPHPTATLMLWPKGLSLSLLLRSHLLSGPQSTVFECSRNYSCSLLLFNHYNITIDGQSMRASSMKDHVGVVAPSMPPKPWEVSLLLYLKGWNERQKRRRMHILTSSSLDMM